MSKKDSSESLEVSVDDSAPSADSTVALAIGSYVRKERDSRFEAEKVKLLALLKAIREEMNQPLIKGINAQDYADMFAERYNFFHGKVSWIFPNKEFTQFFQKLEKGVTSLEKIRLEITLLIAYIQNDIMDIIEQAHRLKQKNEWLQERLREFEIKIAGIQAIK